MPNLGYINLLFAIHFLESHIFSVNHVSLDFNCRSNDQFQSEDFGIWCLCPSSQSFNCYLVDWRLKFICCFGKEVCMV